MGKTSLELLAPAKTKEFGMAAVDHGADAVYIGAKQFGARTAAANPVQEIEALCQYAHFYRARVYVAFNTLLFDHELDAARDLIRQLWNAGADALIIQDMGLLEMDLPPIPLFASTQTDNRTPEKVAFLEKSGFERVILARELSLDQIRAVRKATCVDLEAFVHGALCVCYSGQCYMSAAIGGRSANRGECGQPCRLPWNLVSGSGRILAENRHLLSLKDMNRSGHLAAMAEAGITSFKIEGRLKDLAYVKNITAFYRQKLDALLEGRPAYGPASSGRVFPAFVPDPAKTFNRGETDYFLINDQRPGTAGKRPGAAPLPSQDQIHSFETPKSRGEMIGRVARMAAGWFTLKQGHDLHNGDGLCFLDKKGRLKGIKVNRVDNEGKIWPPGREAVKNSGLFAGARVFRNHDHEFLKQLAGCSARRALGLDLVFAETPKGLRLTGQDENGVEAVVDLDLDKVPARNPARALAVIETQLGKLGSTRFYLNSLSIETPAWFLTAKVLNQARRDLVSALEKAGMAAYARRMALPRPDAVPFPGDLKDFRANVANEMAARFYRNRGVGHIPRAYEQSPARPGAPVMTTRHCILRSLGQCPGQTGQRPAKGPLFLENDKGRFRLALDCQKCEMTLYSTQGVT